MKKSSELAAIALLVLSACDSAVVPGGSTAEQGGAASISEAEMLPPRCSRIHASN